MNGAHRRMGGFMNCSVHRLLLGSSVKHPFALLLCVNPVLSSAARTLESWFRRSPGARIISGCFV